MQWVVEHLTGFLKAYAVLAPVGEVFSLIPFETNPGHGNIVIAEL